MKEHALTEAEVAALAERQLADYDARRPGTIFSDPEFNPSVTDAYRLQIATAGLRVDRGEAVAGYKIGCVSAAVRKQLNVNHPVFGHVFHSEIWDSPAVLPGDAFCQLGIEGEFALEIAEDVTDPESLRIAPRNWVRAVFPVIELHNVVSRGPIPSAAELIANNAIHAGIVRVGTAKLEIGGSVSIRVAINGSEQGIAEVDPIATLHELACLLGAYGISLRKGDIVLAGSPLPVYRISPGDTVQVDCPSADSVCATYGDQENTNLGVSEFRCRSRS